MDQIKITDLISTEYSDFLDYCSAAGKTFVSELTNVDLVAFRASSGRSRDYIKAIREMLEHPVVISATETRSTTTDSIDNDQDSSNDILSDNPSVTSDDEPIDEEVVSLEDKGENHNNQLIVDDHAESVSDSLDIKQCDVNYDVAESVVIGSSSESKEEKEEVSSHSAPVDTYSTIITKTPDNEYTLAYLLNADPSLFEDVNIAFLNLGVRPTNCLNSAKIKTIAEVLAKTPDELKSIRNMGAKSVSEIIQKTKDYISDPQNIQGGNSLAIEDPIASLERVELDPEFRATIEALLTGDEYTTDSLSEEQSVCFEKLKMAAQTVGEEICLEAYLNPAYAITICNSLWEFASPYIQYRTAMNEAVQSVSHLPDFMRQLKAIPFIRAYSAKAGEKLTRLLSECEDETTIVRIPFLCEKLSGEKDMVALTDEINKFLTWLNFDVFTLIASISANIRDILSGKNERAMEVFALRSKGETLEAVGNRYGVTRERIRQIEKKVHRTFWSVYERQKHDLIMLVYALRNGDNVLYYDELRETVGDEFATVLWACIRNNPEHDYYYYSKTLDAIVVKTDSAENMTEETLISTVRDLLTTLPDVMLISEKERLLNDLAEKNAVPTEILLNIFNSTYQQTGQFFNKGRITVVFMCEYVLKHRFQAGFKIADDFESERFKQYMVEFFGERAKGITSRAIDADVGGIGVLCDRGKYIHPDYLNVDQRIIDLVNDYIETSPRSLLPYGELFEGMKDVFDGTQITNKYLLQGALKKYGCRFSTGRDFVRKTKTVTFVDELEAFVADRGVVHKSEIFAEFTSLGEAGLGQVVARSANVFNIDNGYYIHADQFDIQPEDYEALRGYLNEACKDIPVNIRSVHDTVSERFPEFMYRNDFEDRNKLFAALNYMFGGEFSFSRPYIAKLGVSDISNRSVILQHIEDYDSIEIEELIDICDENSINYVATAYLCQMLAPDFVRVNRTTMMRRELTGITDEVIDQANSIIQDLLEVNGYIVASKVNDFLWYPEIDVDWNEFLLENLIVQSKKTNVIYMFGDPLKHPNAIYVSDAFSKDTFDSFLIKILTEEVHKGSFTSKIEMRDWLREEGLIDVKLPNFLESAKYFYVNETGVHCAGE